ncbi:MAG: hypothetical protein WBV35_09590 [Steroidobacteraceae bacterium]
MVARKLDELERKYQHHDDAIKAILSAIRELMNSPEPKRRPIGFTADLSEKRSSSTPNNIHFDLGR